MKQFAISSVVLFAATLCGAASAYSATTAGTVADGIEKYVDITVCRPEAAAPPQYTPDGTAMLRLVDNSRIEKIDIKTGNVIETIFDVTHTRETTLTDIAGFTLSPDGGKILVWRDSQPIYRRSFTACYYVYEIRSRLLKPLSTNHSRQRSPIFSPDGMMVAFVAPEDNNIYIRKLDYGTEVAATTDGRIGEIINGVPDWTYEEEFAATCLMSWSPDNLMLCYVKSDESQVPVYDFPLYGGACKPNPKYELYPGSFSYKYPVAGEPNSVVTVCSYDIETRKTKTVALPGGIEYIPRIEYAYSADRLMVVTLNRAQTRMEIYSVNPRSLVAHSVIVEESKAWLDPAVYENITYSPEGIVIFSSRSGYKHLYQYSYAGALTRTLTSGNYDVTDYYGYDASSRRHFYQSTATGAINRVVSSVDAKGAVKHLSPAEGYAQAWFSPLADYYMLCYSTASKVPVYTLCTSHGDKQLRVLCDNARYAAEYASVPQREFFTFTTSEGVELNGYVVKPVPFDPSRRYPCIMYQYSGPGSQEVLNRWTIDWFHYYAQKGFVVMCVDGRGTGGRGNDFMHIVYKNLGHYETIDQAAAARYAAQQPYVDPQAIGIFGWSYGGYEALMAAQGGLFDYAAAVAVAPVTDWRFYDTVYAERYMLTPGENERGYRESAPINHVEKLGCPLLVMHGTADDNVHVANTMEYVSQLQLHDRYCDMMLFPNMNHSIYGCNSRAVLYSRMLSYFRTHLAK